MNRIKKNELINAIVYLILAALAVAIFYVTYIELVTQEKADRIDVLRDRLHKQIKETQEITEQRDSVISILQDSAHEITTR